LDNHLHTINLPTFSNLSFLFTILSFVSSYKDLHIILKESGISNTLLKSSSKNFFKASAIFLIFYYKNIFTLGSLKAIYSNYN